MEQLLTVKEFATAAGISPQAVYKELSKKDGRLATYLVMVDGQKRLKESAVSEVYGSTSSNPDDKLFSNLRNELNNGLNEDTGDDQGDSGNHDPDIIKCLFRELEKKDQQISELHSLISELNNLVSQEQQLNAMLQQKVFDLEGNRLEMHGDEVEQEVEQVVKKFEQFDNQDEKLVNLDAGRDAGEIGEKEETTEQPTKKKSWLSRLFGW